MGNIDLSNICVFDCETTGLPPKGAKWDVDFAEFPNIVQLAWAVNEKERSFIIKPEGWKIPEASIEVHGITAERANAEGVPELVELGIIELKQKKRYVEEDL